MDGQKGDTREPQEAAAPPHPHPHPCRGAQGTGGVIGSKRPGGGCPMELRLRCLARGHCGISERHRGWFWERRDTGAWNQTSPLPGGCSGDQGADRKRRPPPPPAARAPLAPLAAEAGREQPPRGITELGKVPPLEAARSLLPYTLGTADRRRNRVRCSRPEVLKQA